ncbi:hypothetical protein JB92DRAFT_3050237 [Gautieria morchelliformis]|nr:hypothetical protein JB92DRAFT_3050237 [Gautieria morchelliformis]
MDIRSSNIVVAPATDQSIVCPYHGYKYQKSNFPHSHIEMASGTWLETILNGLAEAYVVEPWD